MLKRSLVFSSPANLSLKDRQIVISLKESPEDKITVPIEDIGVVVIDNPAVSITIPLLNNLADNNVIVVLCNSKGIPSSTLLSFGTNHYQGEILQSQIDITEPLKKGLWKQIVESKIKNQAALLNKLGKNGDKLKPYYCNVKSGDTDNREGIAARIYFQELFGKDFVRERNQEGINVLLNYGYTILRAATARAVVGSGLFQGIGLHHHNRSNSFPLADDLIEPYRPFVDEAVYQLLSNNCIELSKNVKAKLISVLYADVFFKRTSRPLELGLTFTTSSLTRCLKKEDKELLLPLLR
jgi:CRISPR-associated endonuclease cas1, NMENI subtype